MCFIYRLQLCKFIRLSEPVTLDKCKSGNLRPSVANWWDLKKLNEKLKEMVVKCHSSNSNTVYIDILKGIHQRSTQPHITIEISHFKFHVLLSEDPVNVEKFRYKVVGVSMTWNGVVRQNCAAAVQFTKIDSGIVRVRGNSISDETSTTAPRKGLVMTADKATIAANQSASVQEADTSLSKILNATTVKKATPSTESSAAPVAAAQTPKITLVQGGSQIKDPLVLG